MKSVLLTLLLLASSQTSLVVASEISEWFTIKLDAGQLPDDSGGPFCLGHNGKGKVLFTKCLYQGGAERRLESGADTVESQLWKAHPSGALQSGIDVTFGRNQNKEKPGCLSFPKPNKAKVKKCNLSKFSKSLVWMFEPNVNKLIHAGKQNGVFYGALTVEGEASDGKFSKTEYMKYPEQTHANNWSIENTEYASDDDGKPIIGA